jgi:hypothetical protein
VGKGLEVKEEEMGKEMMDEVVIDEARKEITPKAKGKGAKVKAEVMEEEAKVCNMFPEWSLNGP